MSSIRRSSASPSRPVASMAASAVPRGLDVGGEDPVGGLRLQHDHREAVRHQVVQLASDPRSLVR